MVSYNAQGREYSLYINIIDKCCIVSLVICSNCHEVDFNYDALGFTEARNMDTDRREVGWLALKRNVRRAKREVA